MVFDYTCKSNLDFLQNLRKQSNLPALAHENAKYKIKKTCSHQTNHWSSWTPWPFGTTYYTVHKYFSNQMPAFSHQKGKYKQKKTGHQTSHWPSRLTFGTTYLYCKIRYVPLRHSRWQHMSFNVIKLHVLPSRMSQRDVTYFTVFSPKITLFYCKRFLLI